MLRKIWDFHGGVHPPQHKRESTTLPAQPARIPKRLILPLQQHIGEAAETLVARGERVLKGQMIGQAQGYISAPVHAPTSGIVTDIGYHPILHPSGLSALSIVISPDGEDEWTERPRLENYLQADPSHLRNLIRGAGIVGLGGAGFPSFIKLNPGSYTVETLVLNGAECEPFITCDDMLMREHPMEMIAGAAIMRHALHARVCVIGIEDNKPEAYQILSKAAKGQDWLSIVQLPTKYPQGGDKQLIQALTGKEVPSNGRAIHVGVVCHNVGTAYAVYQAIHEGRPLISRYMTITGDAVRQPRNLEVLIGTPVADLLDQCEADYSAVGKIIIGGPMMGFALQDMHAPVIKTTNAIIAASKHLLPAPPAALPCIRCGACVEACPANLLPQQLYWHARAKEFDKMQEYSLFDCIECGCCAYVCPSNIPLVQYYRYAKGEIWEREREKEKAELARRRHEFRVHRQEREKSERADRLGKKKAELETAPADQNQTDASKHAEEKEHAKS